MPIFFPALQGPRNEVLERSRPMEGQEMSDITPRRLSPPLLLPCLSRRYEVLYQQTGLIEDPVICCKSQRDLHEMERSRWPLLLLEAAASSLILELDLALHVYAHPRVSSKNKRLQEIILDALLQVAQRSSRIGALEMFVFLVKLHVFSNCTSPTCR
jgi:hypothetical protein